MFEAFTEPARLVVFRARLMAGRLKFQEIDTRHLLLGFLDVDQGMFGMQQEPEGQYLEAEIRRRKVV